MIVSATQLTASGEMLMYGNIVASTVGVIFLGTPHNGCHFASSRWADLFTSLGESLFHGEDRVVKALVEDSEILLDCLQNFARWVIQERVPVVCFYENQKTNLGRRVGIKTGKIPASKLLVRLIQVQFDLDII